jgi:Carbohydrate family 9 binding domain-like
MIAAMTGERATVHAQAAERPQLSVKPAEDFQVTGTGEAAPWRQAEWVTLRRRQADGHPYETRIKVLYSGTGLYVLMDAADRRLTATMNEDFMDLWNEDVFEVFLWTDERFPVYFEYEISPLNRELPILIPNFGGQFLGWRPWHYEKGRLTRKATSVVGGPKQSNASIQGWRAEFFFPYTLLRPLQNVPPKPGTRWRANFYRMDYDGGRRTRWEWAHVDETFHEYEKFGELQFE